MSDDDIRAAVRAERRQQVELYSALSEAEWAAPSLCRGWRVREVLAHTTMAYRYSLRQVLAGMLRAGGSFSRMADRAAHRDTERLTDAQLLASLRDNVDHPWTPPGGGPLGALSHEVIHGLDVSVALGRDEEHSSTERVLAVLGGLQPKQLRYFGVDLDGVQLRATDADWTYGTGEPLSGRARDLLLLVCGRQVPAGRLTGPAAPRFTPA
ncbi:maleylpyruvate isomerase family mycothiol-dependent enzyme [Geodermatophilus sp. CPCC 206100]|uniref:maleylpyruvate isomerase family mycothiol-dependent enzyme n=1 Tax=Geodermatophilus sp. CPCC 206100 TaxID=3020054 RepID=UPI003AFFB303